MFYTLRQLTTPDFVLWGLVGLLALTVMIFLATLEGRHFRALGLGAPWLRLRLASLPILAIALLAVYGTVAVFGDGPQALAVAYMALFSVGTIVYFGLHAIAGRIFGIRGGHASWIAFSGLVLIGVLPAIGGTLMPFVNLAAKIWKEGTVGGISSEPSPFIASGKRVRLPDGEEVFALRYRAPEGVQLLRADMEGSGHRARDVLRMSTSTICRAGQDIALLWPAERPLPRLYVFWQNAEKRDRQSLINIAPPADNAVTDFVTTWTQQRVSFSASLPREALSLVWARNGSAPFVDSVPRTGPEADCVEALDLPARGERGRPQALRIRVDHALPKGPTWAEISRP
jgi:hypothetical protein